MPYANQAEPKKVPMTIPRIMSMKGNEKITMLTCYDSTFAQVMDRTNLIDTVLIGDSLGMVLQGYRDTLKVTIDQIAYHVGCVARANPKMLIIGDMPFGTFHASKEDAFRNASILIEAGANMVKLEGAADWVLDTVYFLIQREIPVCAHIGLTPQSVNRFGGWKIQGKNEDAASLLVHEAEALERVGASLIVLELMPEEVGKSVTEKVKVPTIGIGAGRHTDGQVLVLHDMLGMNPKPAKFVKNFMPEIGSIEYAIAAYGRAVKEGEFPTVDHIYTQEAK